MTIPETASAIGGGAEQAERGVSGRVHDLALASVEASGPRREALVDELWNLHWSTPQLMCPNCSASIDYHVDRPTDQPPRGLERCAVEAVHSTATTA